MDERLASSFQDDEIKFASQWVIRFWQIKCTGIKWVDPDRTSGKETNYIMAIQFSGGVAHKHQWTKGKNDDLNEALLFLEYGDDEEIDSQKLYKT